MTKPTGRPRKKPAKKAADGVKMTAADRGRAFVAAYMANGFNATQAAIAAGYSPKAATQIGSDLLRRPDVVELLAKERKRLEDDGHVSANEVVAALKKIGFSGRRDAVAVRALELLGKTLSLFSENVNNRNTFLDQDGKPTLPTVRVVFVNPTTGTESNDNDNHGASSAPFPR